MAVGWNTLLAAGFKCMHSLPQTLQLWVRRNLLQGGPYTLKLPLPKYTSLDKRQCVFRHFEVLLGGSLLYMKQLFIPLPISLETLLLFPTVDTSDAV